MQHRSLSIWISRENDMRVIDSRYSEDLKTDSIRQRHVFFNIVVTTHDWSYLTDEASFPSN